MISLLVLRSSGFLSKAVAEAEAKVKGTSWEAHLPRAAARLAQVKSFSEAGAGLYRVDNYLVSDDHENPLGRNAAGSYWCDCKAGVTGSRCKHRLIVRIVLNAHRAYEQHRATAKAVASAKVVAAPRAKSAQEEIDELFNPK